MSRRIGAHRAAILRVTIYQSLVPEHLAQTTRCRRERLVSVQNYAGTDVRSIPVYQLDRVQGTAMMDDAAKPTAEPGHERSAGAYATILGQHLALPIRDYFKVVELEPLPAQLATLLARFEAAVAAHGQSVAFDFRTD